MTKYLAIAILVTGFLVGDAYGEDEAYYCSDTGSSGFYFDEKSGLYSNCLASTECGPTELKS
jgi:hypothetical protein